MVSFFSNFEFGACQVINLNASACASHFETTDLDLNDLFVMAVSTVFSFDNVQYNPFILSNGDQPLNYLEIKAGYLLDAVITYATIIIIPELLILMHKFL